ncbi:hypothetical protein TNIN_315531 [Trichonephila inaurata madagascariensis]|uniref:Uncharacterized protein n=1 Tax=Trichonephila inaurata madagascariensis TaxID=2747483 RepID=A0A8X6Y6J1_9ARAC|nr:hypothetical protein TNIN_315531 [Trichonephila inaurata madagascariensis]
MATYFCMCAIQMASIWDKAEVIKQSHLCFRFSLPRKLSDFHSVKNCFCLKPHCRMINLLHQKSDNISHRLKMEAPSVIPKAARKLRESVHNPNLWQVALEGK